MKPETALMETRNILSEVLDDPAEEERMRLKAAEDSAKARKRADALKLRIAQSAADDGHHRKVYGTLFTSLHRSATVGELEGILYFVKKEGVRVDAKDVQGSTAACFAAQHGKVEVLRLLHTLNADFTIKNGKNWTPAHCAAVHNQKEVLVFLKTEASIKICARDQCGSTPAHYAAAANHVEVLETLHALNEDLNISARNGCTPAHHAAQNDACEVLKLLKELEVDLDAQDGMGDTPAHKAARMGYGRTLKVLRELGADMSLENIDGDTPQKLFQIDEVGLEEL